jgi:hypothetical protein
VFSAGGTTVRGHGRIQATGLQPFVNTPPTANAGPDKSVVCPQNVPLDASHSQDREGNIASYVWSEGGTRISFGRTPSIFLGLGSHPLVLEVFDDFGGRGVDSVVVSVDDAPPTFTFVPPDIATTHCGAIAIGQATATSCGIPVGVTSNAPASFSLGTTLVTWRATSPFGKVTTAQQRVTVTLGDDPSCCPAGTNVIVGNAQANILRGTAGRDCIFGLGGDDQIVGLEGDDLISGGAGRDTINAGPGSDYVAGGDADDTIDSGPGDDLIDGGPGVDTCSGGTDSNALVSCEVASFCTAACCATNTCGPTSFPPSGSACRTAWARPNCLTYVQGIFVSRNGHNWECTNGNCANCATFPSCEPGASGCPWGVVWTDRGVCQ